MTKLLINEPPLLVLPTLASWVGLNEAMILQQIHYWLSNPKIGKTHDNLKWVRNTIDEWQRENFPFWSCNTIRRAIANLESDNLILSTSELNRLNYDKTKWYTINYENLEALTSPLERIKARIKPDPLPILGNGITQNGQLDVPKMGNTIPEITSETTQRTAGRKILPATLPESQQPPQTSEPIQAQEDLDAYFGPPAYGEPAAQANGGGQKQGPPHSADEARERTLQAVIKFEEARAAEDPREREARQKLNDSGWQLRPNWMEEQAVAFLAWTHFGDPPGSESARKGWYKALRGHADQWGAERSRDLYRRADALLFPPERERPADWRPPGGPWGYTNTMAGLAADGDGGGQKEVKVPPGIDLEVYRTVSERAEGKG